MTTILLGSANASPLREPLRASGFSVLEHELGSPASFDSVAVAILDVGERTPAAATQTRRWRIEHVDGYLPILWILRATASETLISQQKLALDSGADACLVWPCDVGLLTSQVKASLRLRASFAQQSLARDEARLIGDQLQKAHRDLAAAHGLAHRIAGSLLTRSLPIVASSRFAVSQVTGSRAGGNFHAVRAIDANQVRFFLADTLGSTTLLGHLIGVYASIAVQSEASSTHPDQVLSSVNQKLLDLSHEEPPFVAMLHGVLNATTGDLAYARAGLPVPVHLSTSGVATALPSPGPYLAVPKAEYPVQRARLAPGERLVLTTDAPGGATLLALASKYHHFRLNDFTEACARELSAMRTEPNDFTMMAIEMNP